MNELMKLLKMTIREGIIDTLHKKRADRIPFVMNWSYSPSGQVEREARNRGMGITYSMPSFSQSRPHVECFHSTDDTTGRKRLRVTYETPVGSVYMSYEARPWAGRMQGGHNYEGLGSYGISSGGSGLVKKPEDYDVLTYMVEDTQYAPYYEAIEYFKRLLGDEGIVTTAIGHSPFATMMIDWIGIEKFYVEYFRHRDKVEELYEALAKSQEKVYSIVANSPADMVFYGDHVDDVMISPRFFEQYFLPLHNKFARVAHAAGKITACHMDGRLQNLKNLIAKSEIDVIHAITPSPMGNLPINEALSLWKDKVLWINYDNSQYVLGPEAVKKHLLKLLRSIVPGDRVIFDASTERWVPLECLKVFANVMEKATLPLSQESIDRIEKSL